MRQALWMGTDATTRAAEDGTLLDDPARFGVKRYGVLVAVVGGDAGGFLEVSLRDDIDAFERQPVGYVEGVYVEPRHRRSGLGGALMHAAEDWSRELGADLLVADVLEDNPDGLAFHHHAGFTAVGETPIGKTGGGGRQVLLRKLLK